MPVDLSMNAAQAANIYANTAKTAVQSGASGGDSTKINGPSFGDMLRDTSESAIETMYAGEKMSARAVIGDADITDVVQAVTAAEVTLQTITAVRDRMISAYQEIMRMPI